MEQFQSLDVVNRNVEQSGINKEQFEALKDRLFDEYMKQQLIEDFFGELEDYVGPEATDEMRAVLAECENDEDIYAALSIPHELREKKFRDFELALETGHSTPAELMQSLVLLSKKYGFGIGYHTSPYDIKPDESGRWDVKATEQDHRDNDMPMAYYSTKYRHLFKKKEPKFIYIVRTENDTHKTDGNWSRAGTVSIVGRVPFSEVFEYVEKTSRESVQKTKQEVHDGPPDEPQLN